MSETSSTPDFKKNGGLVPVIAQDAATGEVLMMAYMNEAAYQETLSTGQAVYFSRSRNELWRKGATSGHEQTVHGIYLDCDADTLLIKVSQKGGACHNGYRSCFYREVTKDGFKVIAEKVFDPDEAYS